MYRILVEETLWTFKQYLTAACTEESEDHRDKTHHSLVIRGKIWMEVG